MDRLSTGIVAITAVLGIVASGAFAVDRFDFFFAHDSPREVRVEFAEY